MAVEYYDREKLYKEVWKEPMTVVSKKYDVSDVALSKTCKKLKVPKPSVGYWAKVQAGQKPKKPPLPKFKDAPKIIIKKSMPWQYPRRQKEEKKDYLVPEAFERAESLKAREDLSEMKIVIPEETKRLHFFVRNTRRVFKEEPNRRRYQDYNRQTTLGNEVFYIDISKDALQRTTIILQALCDAFKVRGFNLKAGEKEDHVQVEIMEKLVSFKISEFTERREIPKTDSYSYLKYEHIPTGRLKLEIIGHASFEGQKSWSDGKKQRLEELLNKVMKGMINTAAWTHEWEKKWELYEIERAKEDAIRKEKERLARIEKERVKQLEFSFQKWITHQKLSQYMEDVKSKYLESHEELDEDFSQWMKWADEYLTRIDPFKEEFPKYDIKDPGYSYNWGLKQKQESSFFQKFMY